MTGERTDPYPPTVEYVDGTVVLLDQTALPEAERYVRCEGWQRVAQAIVDLEVRGAPAIGLAAAIPAVMAYNYFNARIRVLNDEMSNFSSDFLNIVKRHFGSR